MGITNESPKTLFTTKVLRIESFSRKLQVFKVGHQFSDSDIEIVCPQPKPLELKAFLHTQLVAECHKTTKITNSYLGPFDLQWLPYTSSVHATIILYKLKIWNESPKTPVDSTWSLSRNIQVCQNKAYLLYTRQSSLVFEEIFKVDISQHLGTYKTFSPTCQKMYIFPDKDHNVMILIL